MAALPITYIAVFEFVTLTMLAKLHVSTVEVAPVNFYTGDLLAMHYVTAASTRWMMPGQPMRSLTHALYTGAQPLRLALQRSAAGDALPSQQPSQNDLSDRHALSAQRHLVAAATKANSSCLPEQCCASIGGFSAVHAPWDRCRLRAVKRYPLGRETSRLCAALPRCALCQYAPPMMIVLTWHVHFAAYTVADYLAAL